MQMQPPNKRRAERIDTHLIIGYSFGDVVSPMKSRHVNISQTGVAFEVDSGFVEWTARISIEILCADGNIYSLTGRVVRHVLGKEGWMAFEFEENDESFFMNLSEHINLHQIISLAQEKHS
jgi:hypothetical protein